MQKKKTMIIVLLVLFILVGGGGGYLLWRVNQEETVAPTDSDAGFTTECLIREDKTITLLDANMVKVITRSRVGATGSVERTPPNIDNPNDDILTFTNSCDEFILNAEEKKGEEIFTSWEVSGLLSAAEAKQKGITLPDFSKRGVTIKYNDFSEGGSIKPIYKLPEGKEYSITYKVQCGESLVGDSTRENYLSCYPLDGGNQIMPIKGNCLNQKVSQGGSGDWVYSHKKVDSCKRYEFTKWVITEDSSLASKSKSELKPEKREETGDKNQITDVNTNYIVTAVYDSIAAEIKPDPVIEIYTLKYTPGTGGKLSKDGGEPSTDTITEERKAKEDGPIIVAVANDGYVFKDWSDGNSNAERQDKKVSKGIDITANFDKKDEPPVVTPPVVEPPVVTPPVVEPPVVTPPTSNNGSGNVSVDTGGNSGGASSEKMPETAVFSDKSLYTITFGTLVLSLGMIWQYIPFKKFRFRK